MPELRTIQMRTTSEGSVLHELAHAWDDVRNDRARLPDAGNPAMQRRIAEQDGGVAIPGQPPPVRTAFHSDQTLERARDAYTSQDLDPNDGDRSRAFALNAPRTEPMKNPREFYAEGYAVFHRGDARQVDVLRRSAPELYRVQHGEARAEHTLFSQPPPD